jgi:hypothetical protein
MFAKLNKTFETPLYAVTTGLKTFTGINVNGERKGIDYKKIWSPDAEKLYSVIPRRYWKDFHLTIMTINTRIPPHTDTEIMSTINFYIETDNCRTQFYRPNTDNPRTYQIENQTNGYIYEDTDLETAGSFIANPGEVWVLDVKSIHSVEPLGEITLRKAVTLGSYHYEYDVVVEMLKETGNL